MVGLKAIAFPFMVELVAYFELKQPIACLFMVTLVANFKQI